MDFRAPQEARCTRELEALNYFLRREYLAMLAAHSLTADSNPFRDYGMLEAKFLKDTSLPPLPELGTGLQD